MELVGAVALLELMHTNRFPRPCGDHATVFEELRIIKPLGKLAKLRDNWNDLVGRDCIKDRSLVSLTSCPPVVLAAVGATR